MAAVAQNILYHFSSICQKKFRSRFLHTQLFTSSWSFPLFLKIQHTIHLLLHANTTVEDFQKCFDVVGYISKTLDDHDCVLEKNYFALFCFYSMMCVWCVCIFSLFTVAQQFGIFAIVSKLFSFNFFDILF